MCSWNGERQAISSWLSICSTDIDGPENFGCKQKQTEKILMTKKPFPRCHDCVWTADLFGKNDALHFLTEEMRNGNLIKMLKIKKVFSAGCGRKNVKIKFSEKKMRNYGRNFSIAEIRRQTEMSVWERFMKGLRRRRQWLSVQHLRAL